jgi:hypothetical protein
MTSYSIVRVGDDYVVRADDKSILKVASRRRAAQLVSNAAELLNALPPPEGEAPVEGSEPVPPAGARTSERGH